MTMRSVVATLQDLGFTIDQADAELGTITATRHHEYTMRMTVVVFEKGDERISVRANARIGENPVTSARTYQDFFVALDKAMFLTQHNVD
jgi:predicted RNA-binding protein with EMAP domain